MNEKCVNLLKEVIKNNYKNIEMEDSLFDENEFYYEFSSSDKVSENDFNDIVSKMKEIDNSIFVKLVRISGVYYRVI